MVVVKSRYGTFKYMYPFVFRTGDINSIGVYRNGMDGMGVFSMSVVHLTVAEIHELADFIDMLMKIK